MSFAQLILINLLLTLCFPSPIKLNTVNKGKEFKHNLWMSLAGQTFGNGPEREEGPDYRL